MKPFKFKYNRVRRSYLGGSGIDRIRQASSQIDDQYPEEWIASSIAAFARPGEPVNAGISVIDDGSEQRFSERLKLHTEELLGSEHIKRFGHETGFLMKLLDSAIRLPVQAHPDKKTAVKLFGSSYGKNEAWLVLDARPIDGEEPHLLIGFNDKLDKELFIRESISGSLEHGLDMLHKVAVKPGDVFMIPGGLPHAIGPGLTVIEIMEPSDWIVVSEHRCGNIFIDHGRRFNGLEPELAMSMYDFTSVPIDELKRNCCIKPIQVDCCLSRLIDRNEQRYFGLEHLNLSGNWTLPNHEKCCRAGIVVKGNAVVDSKLKLNSGDAFFLPATSHNVVFTGDAVIIMALPPIGS